MAALAPQEPVGPRAVSGARAGALPGRPTRGRRERRAPRSWAPPTQAPALPTQEAAAATQAQQRLGLPTTGRRWEAELPQAPPALPSPSKRARAPRMPPVPRLPAAPTKERVEDSMTAPPARPRRRGPEHSTRERVRPGLPTRRQAGPVPLTERERQRALPTTEREPSLAIPMSAPRLGRLGAAGSPRSAQPPAVQAEPAAGPVRPAPPTRAISRLASPRAKPVAPIRLRSPVPAALPSPARAGSRPSERLSRAEPAPAAPRSRRHLRSGWWGPMAEREARTSCSCDGDASSGRGPRR